MKDDGGPAFPDMQRLQMCKSINLTEEQRENVYFESRGMSLRDYFAAAVLQGMLSDSENSATGEWSDFVRNNVEQAYELADAMLVERAK